MKKKNFIVIGVVFALVFAFVGYRFFRPAPKPIITKEMRIEREFQRNMAASWYEVHQKNIDRLDRNFRSLNDIMEGIREEKLSPEEANERLVILEENAQNTLSSVRNNLPDTKLSDAYYDLLVSIREKTIRYAESAYYAIAKIRIEKANNAPYEVLDNIRVRDIPAGLFVANEVVTLRESLEVKEE